jgi:pilus assembly protein TadC
MLSLISGSVYLGLLNMAMQFLRSRRFARILDSAIAVVVALLIVVPIGYIWLWR